MTTEDAGAAAEQEDILRVDSRGRVNLTRYVKPGTNLIVRQEAGGVLVLEPAVVLTAREFQAYRGDSDSGTSDAETTPAVAE